MPEQPNQSEKNLVDLRTIWTHYVWMSSRTNVGEDEKSQWLDIFLCRAISELAKLPTKNNEDGPSTYGSSEINFSSDDEVPTNLQATSDAFSSDDEVPPNLQATSDAFSNEFIQNIGTASTKVASRLVAILAMELRHLCLCFETYKDVRPLKRYVFEGRGWKILYLLSRIEVENAAPDRNWISNLNPIGPAQSGTDLTIKDLVELLLNLFQVRFSV